jgi:hypothetical protein
MTTEVAIERMPLSAMASLNREEVDIQVATAKKYPRDLAKFEDEAIALTTAQPEFAARCTYAMPRGGKIITGPGIRFAECLQHSFGNTMAAGRVTEELEKSVVAQGVFIDLEKNNRISREVKRKITNKEGQRYNEDMITTTGNAAVSIAVRNAILAGIPRALWSPVYDRVLEVIGDPRDLPQRTAKALEYLEKNYKINPDQICRILRIDKPEHIGPYEIVVLQGFVTALKDGEISVDEAIRHTKAIPSMPRATRKHVATVASAKAPITVNVGVEDHTPPTEPTRGKKKRNGKGHKPARPVAEAASAESGKSAPAAAAPASNGAKITENQFRDLAIWCNENKLDLTVARRFAGEMGHAGSLKELPVRLLKPLYERLEAKGA